MVTGLMVARKHQPDLYLGLDDAQIKWPDMVQILRQEERLHIRR